MWRYVDLGSAGHRIRANPEIAEIVAVRSPVDRLYVLVERRELLPGPQVRDLVLDEVEAVWPDVAVALVRSVPRGPGDGPVDAAASVALTRRIAEEPDRVLTGEPPGTGSERAVVELLCEVLNVRRVSMTDSLPLLGADSLVLVELATAIAARFDVGVDPVSLFEAGTVRDLVRLVFPDAPRTAP